MNSDPNIEILLEERFLSRQQLSGDSDAEFKIFLEKNRRVLSAKQILTVHYLLPDQLANAKSAFSMNVFNELDQKLITLVSPWSPRHDDIFWRPSGVARRERTWCWERPKRVA